MSEGARLSAHGLSASFRDEDGRRFEVLDAVDFAPAPGRFTVITGASGSGKSTLFNLLSGLLPPRAGEVRFDGRGISALGEGARDRWRRVSLGLVFQNFHLLDELGPVQNVTVPALFGAFSDRRYRPRAEALLDRLGVPGGRRTLHGMSRGERQRVAVARALLFDPPVVLADEPTASLDAVSGAGVLAILRDLAREGRTVVVVSHDPSALSMADTAFRLGAGKLEPMAETAP